MDGLDRAVGSNGFEAWSHLGHTIQKLGEEGEDVESKRTLGRRITRG